MLLVLKYSFDIMLLVQSVYKVATVATTGVKLDGKSIWSDLLQVESGF